MYSFVIEVFYTLNIFLQSNPINHTERINNYRYKVISIIYILYGSTNRKTCSRQQQLIQSITGHSRTYNYTRLIDKTSSKYNRNISDHSPIIGAHGKFEQILQYIGEIVFASTASLSYQSKFATKKD